MSRIANGARLRRASQIEEIGFTGLVTGAIEMVGSIPNTGLVVVYRIEPNNHFNLVGLTDDPAIAMQAALN